MIDGFDDVKGIYDRECVWKVFVYETDIWLVHISDQIPDTFSFVYRYRSKIRFGIVIPSAFDNIYEFSGEKIHDEKSVPASFIHIDIYFVDADGFC